jgi:superfamily II DNA/RNA helicase
MAEPAVSPKSTWTATSTSSEALLEDLNAYVVRFNQHYPDHQDMKPYTADDLNKVCYQNATGSGKTLVMHVNLLQFRHYAREADRADELSRVILLTPNEALSKQHIGTSSRTAASERQLVR